MAFQEIERLAGRRERLVKTVHVSAKNGSSRITLAGDVAEAMGRPPFVIIAIGTGSDAGRIALRPSFVKNGRAYKLRPVGKAGILTVSVMAERITLPRNISTTPVPFTIGDGGTVFLDFRGVPSVSLLAAE